MDELTTTLILGGMVMAERIGQKYAHRHARHQDEAVAEAYFCLVQFFTKDRHLFEHLKGADHRRLLGTYVKRALIKYFEGAERCGDGKREPLGRTQTTKETINLNIDEEMIDFLSSLTKDETAWRAFNALRGDERLTLEDLTLIDPLFAKTVKRLRLTVARRLKRIENMKAAGLKVSREVKYESNMDEGSPTGECSTAA